ncbi:MAG: NAD(+) synthase [Candidatus Gracilibacteria bacterium]|nr:NAD(+) synthase [Candidatus Gracilibacteria bacterium]
METIKQLDCSVGEGLNQVENGACSTKKEVSEILAMPNRKLNYKEVSQKLVSQLQEYLNASGQKGFVIGVSGGIDSALVSTLCAMTNEKVTVMDLPIHQKNDEVNRANNHMNWLQQNFSNVERYSIDLTETFETFKKALPEISDETARYMAYVNSRSRLRAVTLYAIGNERNAIVAGTGNKVEDYGIGFFTKYGDGAVDISPIGNLYKSEVYEMARFLGINDEILKARPTDGLHPNGATDEDQIGCSYDELEWAMNEHDEFISIITSNGIMWNNKKSNENFIESFSGRKKEVMKIYLSRHFANAHKMEMPKVFEI